tara:strand:+ start:270 stop:638 length:369 start_codon:yes stop_codon:yes gene_type:complete
MSKVSQSESIYKKHLSEPWFSLIKVGKKKCEGRLNKGDFSKMKKGNIIIFENEDFGFKRTTMVKVTGIKNYESFESYLKGETLEKCLPGIDSLENGKKIYYKYYTKEDEKKYKIVAIKIKNM